MGTNIKQIIIGPKKNQIFLDGIRDLYAMTTGMVRFLKRYTLKMATKHLYRMLCNACDSHCRCRSSSTRTSSYNWIFPWVWLRIIVFLLVVMALRLTSTIFFHFTRLVYNEN